MDYGLQIAKSGVFTSLYQTNVHANNLANINTVGFKPDRPSTRQREAVRAEDGVWNLPSNAMLEKLGAGVLLSPNTTSFGQGVIRETGNPLDVAIRGEGFFVVQANAGQGDITNRLTRDGRLSLSPSGLLVQTTSGLPVLDNEQRPIMLDRAGGEVRIDPQGGIEQFDGVGWTRRGQLGVVDVPDRDALRKHGENAFEVPPEQWARRRPGTGRVEHKAIEGAAINEIDAMLGVQNSARRVSSNLRLVSYFDQTLDSAINTFGRIA